MIGRTLAHYKILEKIGEGGMGEVLLAEDTKLDRNVALKMLPPELAESEELRTRFTREAKAIAALNHPNIVTVHSVEQAEGIHFLTMELVKGETLAALIPKDGMPLAEFLRIAIPTAEAVAVAHEAGIVHRDLKPANVMVTVNGHVKIMDFGLAKRLGWEDEAEEVEDGEQQSEVATRGAELTSAGTILGTPAYMAPEQLRGEPAMPASDVFSLGIVFYEMVMGSHPFRKGSFLETTSAILKESPPSLSRKVQRIPSELERVFEKMLAKSQADRYLSGEELLADLEPIRARADSGSSWPEPTGNESEPGATSLAVLPFVNINRDEEGEIFSDGLTEDLINALAQLPGLRVTSRSAAFRFKGKVEDIREVGAGLEVDNVVEGSVRRSGERLRITVQLVSVSDGLQLWSERYDRRMEDIFDVQDEVASSVADKVGGQLAPAGGEKLVSPPTRNMEAYKTFLEGRYHWNRYTAEGYAKGLEAFERASAIDPEYAQPQAWVTIALSYMSVWGHAPAHDVMPRAKSAARLACDLDDTLAEAHYALGIAEQYYDWDWQATEREYRRAMALSPSDVTVRVWLAIFLTRWSSRIQEALALKEGALEADPVSRDVTIPAGLIDYFTGNFESGAAQFRNASELYPAFSNPHAYEGGCLTMLGRHDEALAALDKAMKMGCSDPLARSFHGNSLARAGRTQDALEVLAKMKEQRAQAYFPAFPIAVVQAGLGEVDNVFVSLEQAYRDREALLTFVGVHGAFAELRSDPRFTNLLKRLGLA